MIHEKIELPVQYREKGIKNNNFIPYIKTYILDNYQEIDMQRRRPTIVICPGGGYEIVSDREAEAVAIKMNSYGFNAVILWYSINPMQFPASLLDLCEAVHYIRERAKEWHVDENKVIVGGFSAGGHLAASLGVYWNKPLIRKFLPYTADSIKPNGLMLCYPVITTGKRAHQSSITNVIGCSKDYTEADVKLDALVDKTLPPVYMWHTFDDDCVPLENSLCFARSCYEQNVPVEYHVFKHGVHGLSLATEETAGNFRVGVQSECSVWPDLFKTWVEALN